MKSFLKQSFFTQHPSLPNAGPGSGLDGDDLKRSEFQHSKGRTAPRAAASGQGRRSRGGASRVPGAPLEGPLPVPKGGPSLHPWGGADFSTGWRDSVQPFCPPEPLSPGKVKAGWCPGEEVGRGRAQQQPTCWLTCVPFLPCSRRDGGEKTAVTRTRAAPCTPSSPQHSLPPSPAVAGLAIQ